MGVELDANSPPIADDPEGVPLIGYHNVVTSTSITSTTAADGFPVTNLANHATHLKWVGGVNTGDEYITVTTNYTDPIDYVGVAKHNFGTIAVPVSVETTDSPPVVLVSARVLADDSPVIFRFTPRVVTELRIKIEVTDTSAPPEAAVVYVGKLLVMERSIKIDTDHVPIPYGRVTDVVNGMSETGNFLGRIVLGEYRQSRAEFTWFTSDFYRDEVDPFVDAARAHPFFWAWSPSEYPLETGYSWLTKDAQPEVNPVTRRIALTLDMRGIA